MINNINKMVGLDCMSIHHCSCTIEDVDQLGMVTPIYLDDNGNEIEGDSIHLNKASIMAIKASLLGIKNKTNRKMFIDNFYLDIEKQLRIRFEIKQCAAVFQFESVKKGYFISNQESYNRAKCMYPFKLA